jgi:hypothetical protein
VEAAVNWMWYVVRHSGRSNGTWRLVGSGEEEKCRVIYGREAEAIRQGMVELRDPSGQTIYRYGAPRLRSKW